MTHDGERRYHEREHAGWLSEQARYGSYTDMDVLREIAMERGAVSRPIKQPDEVEEVTVTHLTILDHEK